MGSSILKKLQKKKETKCNDSVEFLAEQNWEQIQGQYKNELNPYAHKVGFIEGYNRIILCLTAIISSRQRMDLVRNPLYNHRT